MANKKRFRDNYEVSLGKHCFTRKDILAIEGMMHEYAEVLDDRILRRYPESETKEIRKRTRKFADVHVKIGGYRHKLPRLRWGEIEIDLTGAQWFYDADSIKFLPKSYKVARYFQVTCQPSIVLTIKPFSCILSANRQYATGHELKALDSTVAIIERYVRGLTKNHSNRVAIASISS